MQEQRQSYMQMTTRYMTKLCCSTCRQ